MANIYRSLLLVIAGATQKELALHIKYLKVENEILRKRLPDRVRVTDKEGNRLVRFAKSIPAKRSTNWCRSFIRIRFCDGFAKAARTSLAPRRTAAGSERQNSCVG